MSEKIVGKNDGLMGGVVYEVSVHPSFGRLYELRECCVERASDCSLRSVGSGGTLGSGGPLVHFCYCGNPQSSSPIKGVNLEAGVHLTCGK